MEQSSSIEDPTPEAFEELLQDDDTSQSDADSLDDQVGVEMDDEHQLLEPEFEMLSQQQDGSLLPLTSHLAIGGLDVKPDPEDLDFKDERLSSESDQDDDARQGSANSPRSSPGLSLPQRGRGRGRGRGRPRRGSLWSRGQPLLEMYPQDEDLPGYLAEECRMLDEISRDARQSAARGNRNPAVDEDEEDFRDCEGFSWAPMDEWQGEKEVYEPRRPPGPSKPFLTGYDALRAYWDDGILSHIVTETNNYAKGIQSASFKRNWIPTNLDEIWCLMAFWIMLGILKMPTVKSCFSQTRLLRTEVFGMLFTENRYWSLNRAFHIAKGSRADNDPTNPLYEMGPVLDHLVTRFQELYEPEQDICIGDSLTLWKAPLSFVNYAKSKAAKYGIKTCELCESATGYMCSFFVYLVRKSDDISPLSCSSATVLKLVRHRLNLGHVLYMDNWYSPLARYLKRRRTDCVGTLRASREYVPAVIQRAGLKEGEFIARQSGDVTVVALMDSKRVHLLSTFHGTAQINQAEKKPGRPAQYKMKLVLDYNANMGGVDKMDQLLEPYLVERKQCMQWTRKLFKRFLNVSIQNARILVEKSTGTKLNSLDFRLALVDAIMQKHLSKIPAQRQRQAPKCRVPSESRLTERHFPAKIQVSDEKKATYTNKYNAGRGSCVWCKSCNRTTKTTWECPDCEVPLCCEKPCFRLYHTIPEPLPEHCQ